MVKTEPFDATRRLTSPEAQAELLSSALARGDEIYVTHALDVITRALQMDQSRTAKSPRSS